MRLTEILVCMAIFLMGVAAFMGAFVNIQKNSKGVAEASANASAVATTDFLLRKEIQEVRIPYWKNFHRSAGSAVERIRRFAAETGIETIGISPVYEKSCDMEGFQVEWKLNGKEYATREYVRQRIVDEKE